MNRKCTELNESVQHNRTVYSINERWTCRRSFGAGVQNNVSTHNKHTQAIFSGNVVAPYDPAKSNRIQDIISPQSGIATTFLFRYGKNSKL